MNGMEEKQPQVEQGSWRREVCGGGGEDWRGGGSGSHLGSRYAFSHVKEVVVTAHVLGEERDQDLL